MIACERNREDLPGIDHPVRGAQSPSPEY
jgi:hypothetical protein